MTDEPQKPPKLALLPTAAAEPLEEPEANNLVTFPPQLRPTPEDQRAMFQAVVEQLAAVVAPFVPAQTTPDQLLAIVAASLEEQNGIQNSILPTCFADNPQVHAMPTLRVRIVGPTGVEGVVAAPKRLDNVTDVHPALAWAFVIAFTQSPAIRAVLRLYGFNYRFEQTKEDVSQPKPLIHRV